jgi:CheY-like chemotaxis protein
MPLRHILIADPDPDTTRLLAPPLRRRGHSVQTVKNGARALELSVLRPPDLVLFDTACPLLDAQSFRQILRSNPRTEQVPVLITGPTEDRSPTSLKEGFLKKPFNVDEVLARIDQLLRKADAAQRARRGEEGMDGTLGQLPLLDLLQVLGQSRKSGLLRVRGPRGSASVRLEVGQVAQAEAEGARGLKAFFRLLSWKDGSFSFTPISPDPHEDLGEVQEGRDDIQKPLEELLLEGLRQSDELAALRAQLPDPATRLTLGTDEAAFSEQSAVDAEILALVRSQATVGEVIERCRAPDLVAAVGLMNLLARAAVVLAPGDLSARPAQRPLLPPGSAHALRLALGRGRQDGVRARGKILFVATDGLMLRTFLERLAALSYVQLDLRRELWEAENFGTLGRLDVTEDLSVDLMQLPCSEIMRPLWHPFAMRAVGVVALLAESSEPPTMLLGVLARELSLPVVLAGSSVVPDKLREYVPQLACTTLEPAEALRALLLRAADRNRRT